MDILMLFAGAVAGCVFAWLLLMWLIRRDTKKARGEILGSPEPEPVYENAYKIISKYDGTFTVTKEVLRDGVLMPLIQPYRKVFPTREEAEQFIIAEEYKPEVEVVKVVDGKIVPVEV